MTDDQMLDGIMFLPYIGLTESGLKYILLKEH
jgi:hypothetical protein